MRTSRRKILGALIASLVILVGAAFAVAKFNRCASAASGEPQLKQSGWRLAPPVSFENLTIFPVVTTQDTDTSEFATLDEALASGEALITEQGAEMRRTRDGSVAPSYSL